MLSKQPTSSLESGYYINDCCSTLVNPPCLNTVFQVKVSPVGCSSLGCFLFISSPECVCKTCPSAPLFASPTHHPPKPIHNTVTQSCLRTGWPDIQQTYTHTHTNTGGWLTRQFDMWEQVLLTRGGF